MHRNPVWVQGGGVGVFFPRDLACSATRACADAYLIVL